MIVLSSFTARTAHRPASVYARWAQPATWSEWDPEVRSVAFDGPVTLGRKGKIRPRKGPALSFSITDVRPDQMLTDTSSLPGARLDFEHVVEPVADGSSVTVTVRLRGPLAPLWKRILGAPMADAARASVTGLLAHLDAT